MVRVKYFSQTLLLFFLLLPVCKNPDIQPPTRFPPPPPGQQIPGPGQGDSSGGGGGPGGLTFIPFLPQLGALGNPGFTSYEGLLDMGIGFTSEMGTVYYILDSRGVFIFDSTGRNVLFRGMPTGAVAVTSFEPFTDLYTVLFDNSTTVVFTFFGRVVASPFHFLICDQQTSFDWWTITSMGAGSDTGLLERAGIPYDPNSSGGGPVGLEWDIYGNLWVRATAIATNPGLDCQTVPPCDIPCPTIFVFLRGSGGPNCSVNNRCFIWSVMPHVATTVFTGVRNTSLTSIWDFDFDSANRMIFNQAQRDSVYITKPIPDYGEFTPQGNPVYTSPLPIEVIKVLEGTGVHTGAENPHFRLPWGIAVDRTDDTFLVGDVLNDRLVEFTTLGDFRRVYREGEVSINRGATTKTFFGPIDAFFDPFGRIFVIDRGTNPATGQAVEDLYIIYKRKPPDIIPGSIQGRVTDADTGKPIELALVTLYDWNGNRTALTDAEGRYAFPSVLPGRHSLTASKEGYIPETREIDLTSEQVLTLDFRLFSKTSQHRLGGVSGRTVDDTTGVPLNGVRVSDRETGKTDISHSGGIFRISDLPPGTHTLDFSLEPDFLPETRIVEIVAGMEVNIGDVRMKRRPRP